MSDHLERRAVICGLLAVTVGAQCSVLANTMLKLMAKAPLLQVMQLRFSCQLVITLSVVCVMRALGHPIRFFGPSDQRLLLVARAISFSSGLGCLWAAMKLLPIGEATAMAYFSPILCGLMARGFLGEKLGTAFVVQAVVSSLGVLMVVLPSDHSTGRGGVYDNVIGMCLAATAACLFAINQCLTRCLRGVHPFEVQVWQDAVTALILCPCLQIVHGAPIDWDFWDATRVRELSVFVFAGFTGCFLFITGFLLAPASKATLFTYTEVPTSILVQILAFQQVPLAIQLIGACLIVIAAGVRLYTENAETVSKPRKNKDSVGYHGDEEHATETEDTPLLEESRASASH